MSASAYTSLFTLRNVEKATDDYLKQASKKTASGVDRVTWGDVKSSANLFASKLHRDLRFGYNFSQLRPIPIPKPNGKDTRVICVPTIRDRVVQRMLVDHFMTRPGAALIRNSASFAFMRSTVDEKKGVHGAQDRALKLRSELPWVYKSDITSFFDNIPRDAVVDRTLRLFPQPSFRALLQRAVACEVARVDPGTNRRVDKAGIRPGQGVRQGMPISPFLSNVILQRFDKGMADNGFSAVRYADDFIVFCKSRDECLRVDDLARGLLDEEGFTLPSLEAGSKTQIAEPEEAIEFLGLEIAKASDASNDYTLRITLKQVEHIKDELGYFRDFERLARDRVTLSAAVQGAKNRIEGYRAAYTAASNVSQLIKVLDDEARQSTRALFVKAFTEDAVSGLSEDKAMVLGIKEFPEVPRRRRRR